MALDITPADATLGASVRGVALCGDLDRRVFDEIVDAWHEYAVLVFPGQHLDDERQAAFSRLLGPLENVAIFRPGDDAGFGDAPAAVAANRQAFVYLTNETKEGGLAAPGSERDLLLKGNTAWHTDSSFKRVPAKASLLSARAVPDTGGETEWADMRAAWDALDPVTQARLEGKTAVHSYAYSQGLVGAADAARLSRLPPVEHPVMRRHSATGRKVLYIGRHASHIVGEDEAESRALLRRLCDEACRPPRLFAHRWRAGDLVMWDNRAVLHRGRPWPPGQARRMVRTTVAGDAESNEWLFDTDIPVNRAA